MSLREIDSKRVEGKFVDAEGNKVRSYQILVLWAQLTSQAQGQYALLFLLRRCHGLLYRLMSESEPISEELMPIVCPSLLVLKKKALISRQTNYQPSRNVSMKSSNTGVHTLPAIYTHITSPCIRLINYAEMANSTRTTVVYPKDRLFWSLSWARRTSCWRC